MSHSGSLTAGKNFGSGTSATTSENKAYLISPVTDSLLIGGASMIVFALYWLFVDQNASTLAISIIAYSLTFVVNSPHFMASYQLLYVDYRQHIFRRKSFFWAAVVSPLLIAAVLIYAVVKEDISALVFLGQTMYLSVGWHYVKQTYGTMIVTSSVQKHYFSKWERIFLLLNLNAVWAMSWINANANQSRVDLYGISYFNLGLPKVAVTISYWVTGITFLLVAVAVIRNYIKTGRLPAMASFVGFATIYVWYIPTFYHPLFFYFIPFFHSLQYLLFVGTLKKNQASHMAGGAKEASAARMASLKTFAGFFVVTIITGILAFELLPKVLDQYVPANAKLFGPTLWLFAFNVFINVHHYFIDNVIWRGDNEALKVHIVQASRQNALNKAAT